MSHAEEDLILTELTKKIPTSPVYLKSDTINDRKELRNLNVERAKELFGDNLINSADIAEKLVK